MEDAQSVTGFGGQLENVAFPHLQAGIILEATMDSITLLMIGRRLIGLQLQRSIFAPFYAEQ